MSSELFHIRESSLGDSINRALVEGFLRHEDDPGVRRTHLFNGRYENIYLTADHVPELARLLDEAVGHAEALLGVSGLRAGCWFNYMPPGAVTTRHTHDDGYELLSGVYYVVVPEHSGRLVLYDAKTRHEITPQTGHFVFFRPDVLHEVTANDSTEARLSIGINFGLPHDDNDAEH